jgi:hypothetical protein|tara:strand:- start:364 stop:612 length:249 start_codon:yes stop_codon:yes gene_type:complete
MDKIKRFFATIKRWWIWLKSKFVPLYRVTVSFNNIWGDSDDQVFLVKKIITQKEKHLKFRTNSGEVIQFTGAEGLNYKIEEI